MPNDQKLTCSVTVNDIDVRAPHSFRRCLDAEFKFEGDNGSLYVEGVLVRVLDGFAVESVDRDDLNVPLRDKADLLMAIHCEAGRSEDLDPKRGTAWTDFEVDERSGEILSRQADQLQDTIWT